MIPITERIMDEDIIQITRGENFAPSAVKYGKLKELILQDVKKDMDSLKLELDKLISRRKKKAVKVEK